MPASIGTVYINIAPNMTGIQGKIAGGLRGSGSKFADQFGGEISGKSAAIIGVIAGVASAAVNKSISVISAGIKDFVNSASEVQGLRASFLSLTGSVEKTNAVMTALYDFGKETAFSNKDIQSAGRAFLATGQNADQMRESLKLAGDIAGATGAELSQLVLPLTQAYARGTLQTQDFYQILNSGAGALRGVLQEVVKSETGISNLGDAMSEGKVTTDLLWEAMRKANKEGGFAFNGAIKQAQTFSGRMSNLRESITQVGLKIIGVDAIAGNVTPGGIFDKLSMGVLWLTDNVPKIYPHIQRLGDVAVNVFNIIKEAISPVWDSIKNNLLPALQGFWDKNGELITQLAGFVAASSLVLVTETLKILIDVFSSLVDWCNENVNALVILGGAFVTFKAILIAQNIIGILGNVAGAIGWVTASIQTNGLIAAMGSLSGVMAVALPVAAVASLIFFATQTWNAISAINNMKDALSKLDKAKSITAAYDAKVADYKAGRISKAELDSYYRNNVMGHYAEGTNFAPGGMALVGEEGPEVVNLPRGSQVIPNDKLGGDVNVYLNMDGIMTRSRADLREIAKDMITAVNEELKAKGRDPIGQGAI